MHALLGLILFILLAFFYRWEHVQFESDLKKLKTPLTAGELDAGVLNQGALTGHDWRVTAREGSKIFLKRRFFVATPWDGLRYAGPVLFAAAMMIFLQDPLLAAGYITACCLKWFMVETRLTQDNAHISYDVILQDYVLFGTEI